MAISTRIFIIFLALNLYGCKTAPSSSRALSLDGDEQADSAVAKDAPSESSDRLDFKSRAQTKVDGRTALDIAKELPWENIDSPPSTSEDGRYKCRQTQTVRSVMLKPQLPQSVLLSFDNDDLSLSLQEMEAGLKTTEDISNLRFMRLLAAQSLANLDSSELIKLYRKEDPKVRIGTEPGRYLPGLNDSKADVELARMYVELVSTYLFNRPGWAAGDFQNVVANVYQPMNLSAQLAEMKIRQGRQDDARSRVQGFFSKNVVFFHLLVELRARLCSQLMAELGDDSESLSSVSSTEQNSINPEDALVMEKLIEGDIEGHGQAANEQYQALKSFVPELFERSYTEELAQAWQETSSDSEAADLDQVEDLDQVDKTID